MKDSPTPPVRILIGGQGNCGKSTLAVTLYKILAENYELRVGLHELDVHSDTHAPLLGLKPWSERNKRWPLPQEAPPEVVAERLTRFREDRSAIVLGDLPGRIANPYMEHFLDAAPYAICMARAGDVRGMDDWHEKFLAHGIRMVRKVYTVLNGYSLCMAKEPDAVFVHGLDRVLNTGNAHVRLLAHDVATFCTHVAHQKLR